MAFIVFSIFWYNKYMPNYHKETALARSVKNVPTSTSDQKVSDVLAKIRRGRKWDFPYYIFVLGKDRKLLGVASLNKLLQAEPEVAMKNIMKRDVITVSPDTDQERVAILAVQNNIRAVPVVKRKTHEFLGLVTDDVIFQILHLEHTEDFIRHAGVVRDRLVTDIFKARISKLVRLRIPWLLIGLAGGMIATSLLEMFSEALEKELSLVFFIPVILYMSSAVGAQTQTLFIRSLAMNKTNIGKYAVRELGVGFIIALICASIMFLFSYVWLRSPHLAGTVSIAMLVNICIAVGIALLIPALLNKFKKDPAIGAGPFANTVQDIVSLLIYFLVASVIIL